MRRCDPVLVFAVVSAETEHAVELFVRREEAETFLDEVRADEPQTASYFGSSPSNSTPKRARRRQGADPGPVSAPLTRAGGDPWVAADPRLLSL